MTPTVEQLVRDALALTGAAPPDLLAADAPVLSDDALAGDAFYLIGIIGGKDVGKSALVNALVGENITTITSHGPGTEGVVAYAHKSQETPLRALLESELPGRFRIVTHQHPHLKRQVLLDLPDIDSHFQSHLEVTRRMLRHMLFPVWVQSIEKYADHQPQQMLRRVAEGNAADNFLFCLNKVDQLKEQDSAREIGEDFSRRIAKTLSQSEPPRVFMISAMQPAVLDLPELRNLLARERSPSAISQSQSRAIARQDHSLFGWLDTLQLPEQAGRLHRLYEQARELVATRLGQPLLESAVPRLLEDPANFLAMSDEILRRRVTRWPLVNLVHTLLSPMLAVWRKNIGPSGRDGLRGADGLVDAYLDIDGQPLSSRVQAAFAQLRQSSPVVADLYRDDRLWEDMPADASSARLRTDLAATVERQRDEAMKILAGHGGIVAPLFRWLLTIGALLWFPFVQPVLSGFLNDSRLDLQWTPDWRRLAGLIVAVFSGEALLKSVTFLIIWFAVIWLALRWNTQRRLERLLRRWRTPGAVSASINLFEPAMNWLRELIAPIQRRRDAVQSLIDRQAALQR